MFFHSTVSSALILVRAGSKLGGMSYILIMIAGLAASDLATAVASDAATTKQSRTCGHFNLSNEKADSHNIISSHSIIPVFPAPLLNRATVSARIRETP